MISCNSFLCCSVAAGMSLVAAAQTITPLGLQSRFDKGHKGLAYCVQIYQYSVLSFPSAVQFVCLSYKLYDYDLFLSIAIFYILYLLYAAYFQRFAHCGFYKNASSYFL
jgi:hypothetical protein